MLNYWTIDLQENEVLYKLFGTWKIYHSGNISKGLSNGFDGSPIIDGSRTAKPIVHAIVPKITTGKIYKRSLDQVGSLY